MSASATALRSEIKESLAKVGLSKIQPEILSQCVAVASTLQLSPKQMAECWEAFSLNRNVMELTDRWMPSYKNELLKQSDRAAELLLMSSTTNATGAVIPRSSSDQHDSSNHNKRDAQGLHMVTPPAKKPFSATSNSSPGSTGDLAAALSSSTIPTQKKVGGDGRFRVSLSPGPPPPAKDGATTTTTNSNPYNDRVNRGKVVFTYNPNQLEAVVPTTQQQRTTPKCTISYSFKTNVQQSYRHMFTTTEERSQALDQHLVQLGDCIATKYGIVSVTNTSDHDNETSATTSNSSAIAPLEAVGVPRQEKICCIGRICNSAHEGRINDTSILLEGSRYLSGGQRVEVDLSYMKATKVPYSLFPGQIVAIEGVNSSGRKLVAHRICEGAAHDAMKSSTRQLLQYHHNDTYQDNLPLKVMTACGPFTCSDNLDYVPLLDFIQQILLEQPDVVILCGPFVDVKHDIVLSGHTTLPYQDDDTEGVCVPYETIFANKIAVLLEELFATEHDHTLTTQFVLVPSLEDAIAEWVYPQPPLKDRIPFGKNSAIPGAEGLEIGTLGLHHVETAGDNGNYNKYRRVHCVSNPCTLQINEIVIGVTSTDVLFHMSSDETNSNLESGSRLGRLGQHILQQRSYYPLFPAALHKSNLNWKQMEQWHMPCQPDILIVPSTLKTFAQTVLESTVILNPGRLTVGRLAGTYAIMDIHPIRREILEQAGGDDVEIRHAVHDRTRIEIKRI